MKILFIAPLPPPVTGHSLVSRAFLDHLVARHEVRAVDMGKTSFKQGVSGAGRIFQVAGIVTRSWWGQWGSDAAYLTISESMAGNIKDLMIFLACYGRLPRMYLHLHGGSIRKMLWDSHPFLERINRFFYGRMGGVIISGDSHRSIFRGMINDGRVHAVPNFAPEELFVDWDRVDAKHRETDTLRILYISSMQPEKGYTLLLDAYQALAADVRSHVQVDFAGRFDTPAKDSSFRDRVAGIPGAAYHGVVDEATKIRLFREAHVLCLPSRFLEGQPIAILEAYASGCTVITTGQPGIRDIFQDGVNGLEVDASGVQSLADAITRLAMDRQLVERMALANRKEAGTTYRKVFYCSRLSAIIGAPGPEDPSASHCRSGL